MDAADEMGQTVARLAVEVPKGVYGDVATKWDAACAEWQGQLAALEDEVERLRDELSNEIRFRHELVARLRIERDRYREAIERHQERVRRYPYGTASEGNEADRELWAALDDAG